MSSLSSLSAGQLLANLAIDGKFSPQNGDDDNDISPIFCQIPSSGWLASNPNLSQFHHNGFGAENVRHLSGHLSLFWVVSCAAVVGEHVSMMMRFAVARPPFDH
jgi:hypothetical protein